MSDRKEGQGPERSEQTPGRRDSIEPLSPLTPALSPLGETEPCTTIQPLLPAYELGAAEGPERDACDAHLATCATCLSTFLRLKRIREDAAAFDERPAPAIRASLRDRVARRSKKKPALVAAALAAAAAIAVALALRFLSPQPEPAQTPAVLIDSAPLPEDLL